jgi:hypothetical protein
MTKTPERIWLDTGMQPYRVWTIEMSDLPQFRRADPPAPDALADPRVVALVEALRDIADEALASEIPDGYGPDTAQATEFHRGYDAALLRVRAALAALEAAKGAGE